MPGLPYALPMLLPGVGEAALSPTTSDTGGSDGTLYALTSHGASALALLIQEYQDSPHLKALIRSYVDRVQELETGLASVYEFGLDVNTATGSALDLLGKIVRESRDDRDDEEYRRSIRTRILVNRSQGRIRDLIAIVRMFEGMDDTGAIVTVREYQPARVTVHVGGVPVNAPEDIHARLLRAKAAGVALQTVTNDAAPAPENVFLLGGAYDKTELSTGLAWAGGDSRGGYLSHVRS